MSNSISRNTLFALLLGGALLLCLKLFLAARLDLYSDEIFYWLASTRLALAYSDLPFMTALLVWLGSTLDPGNTLAVRIPFILLGSSVPLLVFWLAAPITGRQQALCSALLALCIPLGGFLGLLAVPDVPLLCFGLLTIGFFERSIRTDRLDFWMATGLLAALGLATHYRFLLFPVAALLFLLLCKPARQLWRNPKLWLAAALAGLGLIPVLWFNLNNQLASASFYLVERHPWTFQPSGLLHLFKQAGLVTPPLYLLLGFTLWLMIRDARRGEVVAALLASFAGVNLLVYLVLAPWTDAASTSIHWPLSGYFPLLVYAPRALEAAGRWAQEKRSNGAASLVAVGIPSLGYCGSLLALLFIGAQAYQAPLQALLGPGILSNKLAGWREFAAYTEDLLERRYPEPATRPLLVADNYYTAAQITFAGLSGRVFTLDDDKAVRDGRLLQLQLWEMHASGLAAEAGHPALFISEDSTLTLPGKDRAIGAMCRHSEALHYLERLSLFNGEKSFSYYSADALLDPAGRSDAGASPCPYPARAWIDSPTAGATLSGNFSVTGWAFNEDIGVESVRLLVDGDTLATMNYGEPRPDVVSAMAVASDPNAPDLGFNLELNTREISNGDHRLSIEVISSNGATLFYGERQIEVRN